MLVIFFAKFRCLHLNLAKFVFILVARSQSIGLSCEVRHWDAIHIKTNQQCRAEDCLAIDMEWFASKVHWQGNPVISKETSIVCCCSWQTLWTLTLTTEKTADIHYWNIGSVDKKVVQSLIHYYRIFRTRLHVHWKKGTLKFKLLSLLNHMCYFNKICSICGLNPRL